MPFLIFYHHLISNVFNDFQDGVHLCAFPEGTRSKDGHILRFKNDTFKITHKVGAPVVWNVFRLLGPESSCLSLGCLPNDLLLEV